MNPQGFQQEDLWCSLKRGYQRLSEASNSLPSSSSGVNCSGFPSITCINLIAINHNVSRSSQCLLVGTIKRRWFDFCSKDSYRMPINTAKYSRFFFLCNQPWDLSKGNHACRGSWLYLCSATFSSCLWRGAWSAVLPAVGWLWPDSDDGLSYWVTKLIPLVSTTKWCLKTFSSSYLQKIMEVKVHSKIKFLCQAFVCGLTQHKEHLVRRHYNVQPNSWCVLCSANTEKDLDHLFFTCPFATACWHKLGIQWNVSNNICNPVLVTMESSGLPFFMKVFVLLHESLFLRCMGNLKSSQIQDFR